MVTLLAAATPDPASDHTIALDAFAAAPLTLEGDVFHVQGLDLDSRSIFLTSVDMSDRRGLLHRFNRAGRLTGLADLTDGARYHVGGMSLDGDLLWVPVAEYRPDSTSRIVAVDKHTLAVVSSFLVDDHIGAVTADGERIYGVNWNAERFYVWTREGRLIASTANTTRAAYQDLKIVNGTLVASGIMPDHLTGTLDTLDPDSLAPRHQLPVGRMDAGPLWTSEGMALHDGKLFLLPRDGHDGVVDVYIFDMTRLEAAALACEGPGVNIPACMRAGN